MKRIVSAFFTIVTLSGCVSLELPDNLVSDTAQVAKDAYHKITGKSKASPTPESAENSTSESSDEDSSTTPADTIPSATAELETHEYEYTYVGDDGVSIKEAKNACVKNAKLLARRERGEMLTESQLVSEQVEVVDDTIVVTCRVAQQ